MQGMDHMVRLEAERMGKVTLLFLLELTWVSIEQH